MKQLFGHKWLAVFAAALIAGAARSAHACAMCGLPLGDAQTHAYNSSVLFMIAAPYSICAIGAAVAFFAYRSACRRRTEAEDSAVVPEPFANR